MIGRIPIRFLSPVEPEGRWHPKAYVGEVVPFEATIFREGHGILGAEVLLTAPDGSTAAHRMTQTSPGTDRWRALATVTETGEWSYRIRAWADDWATWLHAAEVKLAAGQDVELMLATGAAILAARDRLKLYRDTAATLTDRGLDPEDRLAAAKSPKLLAAIDAAPFASLVTESDAQTLRVERARAGLGAWYEFFPRSEGAKRAKDGTWTSGTFRTAMKSLDRVAGMGFDVLYLPPIHPIGVQHRKGPNNSPTAGPGDPGSPWAIGGPLAAGTMGGHDAIHPDLGTIADFRAFMRKAKAAGIEVALDLALQCSPDHPWVTEHPEWFAHRVDGTIAYAENPPKKYQDIYPLDFDGDPEGLYAEILRIVRHWIAEGVTIFRVDNPHTKPLDFWERLLADVRSTDPDVVFLAEAFTRPAMLKSLAGAGFQQSYTYFTWRNTKPELEEFLSSIAHDTAAFLRPNLWVNTPDILTEYLQHGGRAAYKVRAVLAALGSPSWGMYAGYELQESEARPGSEENLDNEKYEYKQRDWSTPTSLAPYIALLNDTRRTHPALQQLRNLTVHWSDDDAILVFAKHLDGRFTADGQPDTVIAVVNLDPIASRETMVHLDLTAFGIPADARFDVVDQVTGARWPWSRDQYVKLDPAQEPAHVLVLDHGTVTS